MFTHELQYYCLHDYMFSHKSLEIGVDFTIVFLILSVELVVHLPGAFFLTIARDVFSSCVGQVGTLLVILVRQVQ